MTNKKYIVFSDVDGTIYSHSQTWSDTTEDSIKKAMQGDIEFIVCTGNPYFDRMKALHKKINNRYFIGSSGAYVYDIFEDKEILVSPIEYKDAKFIFDFALENEIGLHWWDSKRIYYNKYIDNRIIDLLKRYISAEIEYVQVDEMTTTKVHKMEINLHPDAPSFEVIDVIEKKLLDMGVSAARVNDWFIEITSPNANKGYAAKHIANLMNIDKDNFMTIGDSANDHSMLAITEHSYAMGNADEKTKSVAKKITDDVLEDGLGKAMEDFIKNKTP